MKKRTLENIITGALVAVGVAGIISFAAWRCEVNAPSVPVTVAIQSAESERESILESIKAEQTETAGILKRVAEYADRVTAAEILQTCAEVGTKMSLPEPTTTETQTETEQTPTETPTETPTATETNATPESVQIINETTAAQNQTFSFSAEDETWLLRVASCEAGNQGVVGIALVMRVILNRSIVYNMSIHDVVFAPRQFSVIGMPLFESGYIAPDAWAALDAIKNGWDESQGALFFCAPWANSWHKSAKTFLFQYGGHEFYK